MNLMKKLIMKKPIFSFLLSPLFLLLVLLLLVVGGCSSSTEQQSVQSTQTDEKAAAMRAEQALIDEKVREYNQYSSTVEEDVDDLTRALDKWNILMEQYDKGASTSTEDLEKTGQEYTFKAALLKPQFQNIRTFLVDNEQILKKGGIDVITEKQTIDKVLAAIDYNTKGIDDSIKQFRGR